MKKLTAFFIALNLLLVGCSDLQQDISNGRDMKLLLDSKGIDCESFDVDEELVANGEILTCLDGTVKNEPFAFIIWPAIDDRDAGFAGFCMDLKRRGNAQEALIVEDTWVAYSESSFFPAEILADELGAEIISGESFCLDRGLEIGAVLSKEGIQACDALYELAEEAKAISIDEVQLLTANNIGFGFQNGSKMNVDKEFLMSMSSDLWAVKGTLSEEGIPLEIASAVDEIEPNGVYTAATKHENGTAPMSFWVNIPSWAKNKGSYSKAEAQELIDELNEQYIEHNVWVAEFKVELAFFNLSLARVLDACSIHANFDWAN